MILATDDHLGRVDRAFTLGAGIGALSLGVLGAGEIVLPPKIVPVVHVQGQRDDIIAIGKLAQDSVGRRAGRTAL